MKEVIEANLKNLGGGGVARDMAAEIAIGLVRANDHGERVPPDDGRDPFLHRDIAWKRRLPFERDRIAVRQVGSEIRSDAELLGLAVEGRQKELGPVLSRSTDNRLKRSQPFGGLLRIGVSRAVCLRDFCEVHGRDQSQRCCPQIKTRRAADGAKDDLICRKISSKCCYTACRRHNLLKKALDPTDIRILTEIQEDASLTNVALAERVGLSPSPCLARVRALEEAGVIARRVTLLDASKLGPSLSVFIQVTLEKQIEEMLESFEQSVKRFPEVMECYLMTGDLDYLLRVVVRDTIELQHFIIERLTKARGVANIRSSFALKQVKYKTALPESVLARLPG